MRRLGKYYLLHHDELEKLAYRDSLTGLHNRAFLIEQLDREIAMSSRSGTKLGVFIMDLNGFKKVNDRLGHDAGDEVLKIFAHRLKHSIRKSDFAARLGGDEFAVLLPNVKSRKDLDVIARKMDRLADQPIILHGKEVWIRPSIGASIFPDHSESPDELRRLADQAMYKAKRDLDESFYLHEHEGD